MLAWFRSLFSPGPRQTTFCYCPSCYRELCAGDSFVSDDDRGVQYRCERCGETSWWDFDTYPMPVLATGPRGRPMPRDQVEKLYEGRSGA